MNLPMEFLEFEPQPRPVVDTRMCDHRQASELQMADLYELKNCQPLTRHEWLQDQLDNLTGEERLSSTVAAEAMLTRMDVLTNSERRDLELEAATVEMGFRFSASSDYDGNPFSYVYVSSDEMYEREDEYPHGSPNDRYRYGPPTRSERTGMGDIPALFQLGKNIGHDGENARRWFIAYRAQGIAVDVPFDSITEIAGRKLQGG